MRGSYVVEWNDDRWLALRRDALSQHVGNAPRITRPFHATSLQLTLNLIRRRRLAKQESLSQVAAKLAKQRQLTFVLDALGRHAHPQRLTDRRHSPHDLRAAV